METIEWVRDPNLAPRDNRDSTVFVSAVAELFEQSRDPDKIRDLLTYLLLKRQPSTNEPIPNEYEFKMPKVSDRIIMLKDATQREIERYVNGEHGHPWSILQILQEANKSRTKWWNPESVALWPLAIGLASQQPMLSDVCVAYNCLKLSNLNCATPIQTPALEFTTDKIRLVTFLHVEAERLCETIEDPVELINNLSYIGCYTSLVRACRMVHASNSINVILRKEVSRLHDYIKREKASVYDRRH